MSNKTSLKPLSAALGAAFITSLAGTTVANAADNPFGMTELSSGYMVADSHEGKCGSSMKEETSKEMKEKEGKCGGAMKTMEEGKCGEGKCGAKRESHEGKCGAAMKPEEGKCGANK
jgi:uncharacterized low-complexity protein